MQFSGRWKEGGEYYIQQGSRGRLGETNITCSFSYAALSFLCVGVYGNKIVEMPGNQKVVHKGRKEALGETSSKDNRTRVRGECLWGHWGKGCGRLWAERWGEEEVEEKTMTTE